MRTATPDDAEAIEGVRIATWKFAYRGVIDDDHLDGLAVTEPNVALRRQALASGRTRAIVAESGGEVVGFSMYGDSRDEFSDAEVYAIYVLPGHLSTGQGRALMTATVADIPPHQTVGLWVLTGNPRARRFYERFGFTASGRAKVEDGLEEIHYVLAARRH
ncbi:GNAT family N-acetyltransferase [Nonomuraea dietziae]|uniref:Ribosomal protein S18 acetylase RimI-like enzyme n=1 Tax=Nonomuraea dietziae TaxID=65515 RepID=A0A7W5UY13_9ACTN|nr:GNAT family N-acetyltransferase [Nonomuraea dietziae]MBB3726811.1 ribosomal protein S18 acetylase RimI-like enzyme [Nonomuraea dietziae]